MKTVQEVLVNLENYDGWGYRDYRMTEDEAKVCIEALKRMKKQETLERLKSDEK